MVIGHQKYLTATCDLQQNSVIHRAHNIIVKMMLLSNFFPFLYVFAFLSGALASTDRPPAKYVLVNGDLYKVDGSDSVAVSDDPMPVSRADRQKTVWEAVNSFESYKTSSLYER